MTTIHEDIAAILSGSTANFGSLLALLRRIATSFDSQADVEAATIPGDVGRIAVTGYAAAGDGGFATFARWTGAGEPGHPAGKLQSADGGWWVLDDHHPNPRQFGAAWDGVTNDTPPINIWARFLRYARRRGEMPGGTAFAADTLYLAGATFEGAGSVKNKDATYISGTLILCDGNPAVAGVPNAETATSLFARAWRGVTFAPAGGTVAAIDLPDHAAYIYQVGCIMGLNIEMLADENFVVTGGVSGHDLVDVTFDDFSGHGIMFLGCSGKNRFDNLFIRDCGKVAAAAIDNARGCGIYISMACVDIDLHGIHIFGGGDPSVGTAVRVGDLKSETDAQGVSWTPPASIKIGDVYCENYPVPIDVRACSHLKIAWPTLAANSSYPGTVELGHPQNPAEHQSIQVVGLKTFNIATVNVWSGQTSVMLYRQQQASATPEWRYRAPLMLRRSEPGAWLSGYRNPLAFTPVGDVASDIGTQPRWRFVPWLDSPDVPGTALANLLAPFGATAGDAAPSNGWVSDGAGYVNVSKPSQLAIREGEEVYFPITGLTAGEMLTVMLWLDCGATADAADVTYRVTDGAAITLIDRSVASGTALRIKRRRLFNVQAPASGVIRVYVKSANAANNLLIDHPIVCRGAAQDPGPALTVWPTTQGAVPVAASRWPLVQSGSGSPEGVLSAPVGMLYLRTNGGTTTTAYVKESGTGNTGWIAK
jgi:hypothetical protein